MPSHRGANADRFGELVDGPQVAVVEARATTRWRDRTRLGIRITRICITATSILLRRSSNRPFTGKQRRQRQDTDSLSAPSESTVPDEQRGKIPRTPIRVDSMQCLFAIAVRRPARSWECTQTGADTGQRRRRERASGDARSVGRLESPRARCLEG